MFSWILSNKLICFFGLATIAFGISTIVLAVDNSDLNDRIAELEKEVDTTTTETSVTEPTETSVTEPIETTESEPPETTEEPDEMFDYRLSTDVVPTTYDLSLYPHLTTGLFTGTVVIEVELKEDTSVIKLHSNGLTIKTVSIDQSTAVRFELDAVHELLILQSPENLEKGKHVISIEYDGDMKNRIVGLYKSTYTNEKGEVRSMATSKFEPTYARQAFPCFDEPNMKAVFTVHLLKPKDSAYIALSNMPELDDPKEVEEGVMVSFEPSEKMSTYLACFIVSDFISKDIAVDMDSGETIPLRVFATHEQIDKVDYALTVGKKVIEYFNDYFDIDYPLPKLDMAAIPDFVSGAMEHWGLVTFRETALLYDEKISSSANKQRVATVIAHELAHSWFGNMVTMDWWNDLWLNEGFASYIEYKGVNAVETDWSMMDQFIVEDLHPVLKIDSALSSHPIVQTVLTPDEITSIFDTISYSKGASVLRMLEDAVTEPIFKKGVTMYLKNNEFANAVTEDLWRELAEQFKEVDVKSFMDTWTVQMGYPVLDVTEDGGNLVITQKRYLTNEEEGSKRRDSGESVYNYKWIIPITYVTDTKEESKITWFMLDDEKVTIAKPPNAKWIKLNRRQVGYYRVNYNTDTWKSLIEHLPEMEAADRTHLIEETFRLAESGHVSYDIPFELSKQMATEREYVPLNAFSTVMGEVMSFMRNSDSYNDLEAYVRKLIEDCYKELGFTENQDDSHLTKRMRSTILNLACKAGMTECNDASAKLFQEWINDETVKISQDLRQLVYIYGMKNSPIEYWDKLFERFHKESDAGEKLRLLYGLASVNDPSHLYKLLELATKNEEYVRGQDYFTCVSYISYNPIGTCVVWDYIREHWQDLVNRFTINERNLGNMIPTITQSFSTQTKLEEMQHFFEKYPNAGAGASARLRALERVRNNIKWLSKNKETVENWVTSEGKAYKKK